MLRVNFWGCHAGRLVAWHEQSSRRWCGADGCRGDGGGVMVPVCLKPRRLACERRRAPLSGVPFDPHPATRHPAVTEASAARETWAFGSVTAGGVVTITTTGRRRRGPRHPRGEGAAAEAPGQSRRRAPSPAARRSRWCLDRARGHRRCQRPARGDSGTTLASWVVPLDHRSAIPCGKPAKFRRFCRPAGAPPPRSAIPCVGEREEAKGTTWHWRTASPLRHPLRGASAERTTGRSPWRTASPLRHPLRGRTRGSERDDMALAHRLPAPPSPAWASSQRPPRHRARSTTASTPPQRSRFGAPDGAR